MTILLLVALLLRLRGLSFGLPALYDPDEPIFVLTGLKLLRDHTLNPGWFGHPGSTTIYMLAVIDVLVFGWGHFVTGRLADTAAFGKEIYSDPTIVFLPGRVFILLCGMACILLTFRLARRLFDDATALVAAAMLALDPVHIRYSQIIRTDMHATMFMLLSMLGAVNVVGRGRTRDFVLAGAALGFACATKWPAAAVGVGVVGAAMLRWRRYPAERRVLLERFAWFPASALIALFLASPYIFLDFSTVMSDVRGEVQPFHVGATGFGLLGNMSWYLAEPLHTALSPTGLALAAAGLVIGSRRSATFAVIIVSTAAVIFVVISAQALIWERWTVPLLPLLSIAAAAAAVTAVRAGRRSAGRAGLIVGTVIAAALVAVPLARTTEAQAAERDKDTRRLATDWARRHIAPGSSVAIEYLAFDVLAQPWRFLYPAGDRGCVDVRANLAGKIRYSTIGRWRGGRSVVDLGNIPPTMLGTCRADWLVMVNYDRYLAEAARFPREVATYRRLMASGTVTAVFRPVPGHVGGPVVRLVRLPPTPPAYGREDASAPARHPQP